MTAAANISFGLNVRQPDRLETRSTARILSGIQSGEWQAPVARVRELPHDSPEQKEAKKTLPFATWAGVFTYRANDCLVEHSGQIGVDVDELGTAGAVAVLQAAVADKFCLAAFRSARGEGVRLLFRVPQSNAVEHPIVFEHVAEHVRKTYDHDPDPSGKDVSRASFMSYDTGLWVYPLAEVLPIVLPGDTQRFKKGHRCVSSSIYSGQLAETWPEWYGRNVLPLAKRPDGTGVTHGSLLVLGKSLAIHAERIKTPLTTGHLNAAFDAWWNKQRSQGVALRCEPETYRRELSDSVAGAQRKPWFKRVVDKWLRWKKHPDFPHEGLPHGRIMFAIRQHCAETRSSEFYLGARDAALIGGGSFNTGARVLRALVKTGYLEKVGERQHARHAQTYRLLK